MASNDFLPFAAAGGANVVTQATYAGLAALSTGYQSGVANSAQLNKTWRQSSIMAAVLAQLIADTTSANATDDGTTATLLSNLKTSLQLVGAKYGYAVATGTANAHNIALTPALTARIDGMVIRYKAPAANTGALTLNDGLGPVPIWGAALVALQGGEIVANGDVWIQYNSSISCYVMVDSTGGAAQVAPGTQSNHAVNLGQFAASLAASGYVKIPVISGGVLKNWIVQTGVASATTGGSAVTFPLTFPTSVMGVFTGQNNGAGQTTNALSISVSGFTFITSVNSNNYWLAIGY